MKDFYTYAYLREDGTPYYVGKGTGRRLTGHHGTLSVPPKDRRLILKSGLTEEEAFRHEVYLIAILGRKDLGTGCLRNLTDGGDGVSGRKNSEETKKRMSEAALTRKGDRTGQGKGKEITKEQRAKISNTLKGNKRSEESRRKQSEGLKKYWASKTQEERNKNARRAQNGRWT